MFLHTVHKRTLLTLGQAALFILLAAVLLRWPTALANGIRRGLSVCGSVIIPTLYPFMIFAGLLADSPLCTRPGRLSAAITRRLFHLPACCGPAIVISLLGGYPAGGLAIARLRDSGQISDSVARRMSLFCVNGGPGFIVSTVGAGLLGSPRAGWLLFAAHAVTSLGMGIFLGNSEKHTPTVSAKPSLTAPPRPLAVVVQDCCGALLAMCGFVLLAAAGLSVWEASGLPLALQQTTGLAASGWSAVIAGLTEVCSGCIAIVGNGQFAPFWLSLCLGWGGLSVQGQLAVLLGHEALTASFYGARVFHGCVSGALAMGLFHLIPIDLPTSGAPTATPFYSSFSASAMLLLFSLTAMLCFYPKKTGNLP